MRKRPIGVTLLALVFLWIGCGGTLFFPVIVFSGGFSQLWEHLASGWIQSPLLMKIASVFLTSIWFLFYVAYAFIGFGLWKLKDWARKSVVIICAAEIVIGAIVSSFFLRPAGTLFRFSSDACFHSAG